MPVGKHYISAWRTFKLKCYRDTLYLSRAEKSWQLNDSPRSKLITLATQVCMIGHHLNWGRHKSSLYSIKGRKHNDKTHPRDKVHIKIHVCGQSRLTVCTCVCVCTVHTGVCKAS